MSINKVADKALNQRFGLNLGKETPLLQLCDLAALLRPVK
jgi:hypothetical protein